MKQLISIPSTKPQQFLYTDFSVVSAIDHPKHSLIRIINYIKNVLKMRIYLCYRDIQELYQNQPTFFNHLLAVYSPQEMWNKVGSQNGEYMQEREIVRFFTKIVVSLTREKNQLAEGKKFEEFAEVKSTIQWLQGKIVQMEGMIRDRIKQAAIRKRNESQQARQLQFAQKSSQIKQELQQNFEQFETKLLKKHRKEQKSNEKNALSQIQKQGYLYKASKHLQEAKDQSLLAKLAPYKSQKKRPFQCRSLQKKLEETGRKAKEESQKKVEEFKFNQANKLRKRHMLERDVYLSKLENKNMQTIARIQIKKNELDRSQSIKMQKLINENNKLAKQRVQSLQKSLRTYSTRDQSTQIRRITKSHHQTIQFINNIQDIIQTQKHSQTHRRQTLNNTLNLSSKYLTLDLQSDWTKNKKINRYSDDRLENKIIRKIKNQTMMDKYGDGIGDDGERLGLGLGSGRRSLVDLYDQQLRQV